jgi:glucans biosynthesis protein C
VIDNNRIHYLDNLRALAMFAGVLFHAALAYSPLMHPFWLTADRGQSVWVDVAVWFPHMFRMPLFFAIAGFFAARQVSRRGVGGMLRNRLARVLLPLLIFLPLVSVSIGWFTVQALSTVRNASPLLTLLRRGDLPPMPPQLTHLWFLYYLMWFYLLICIADAAEWKLPAGWIRAWSPATLLGVAPLLLVPSLASVPAPTPAPESLFPQLWALVFYGLFFFSGYGFHSHQQLVSKRLFPMALPIASLAAYSAFLWLLKTPGGNARALAMAALQACVSVWMTLWCLQAGRSWINVPIRWLRFLSDASYWTYVVHLPILFAIQYRLMDWSLPWPLKWAFSVLVTLAACLASYRFAVRGTLVGRLLNGRVQHSGARL